MNKRYSSFLLLSMCCGITTVFAMEKKTTAHEKPTRGVVQPQAQPLPAFPEPTKHGLLIFLDDSEHGFGVIMSQFFGAFTQEAAPIIVSASVLANLKEAKDVAEKNQGSLSRMIYDTLQRPLDQQGKERLRDLLVAAFAFGQVLTSKWIMKEINPQLYLLIPKNYLQDKKIDSVEAQKFVHGGALTRVELQLGLKVNHMRTVGLQEVRRSQFLDYFVRELRNIFVTTREYAQVDRDMIPQWVMYLTGHGSMGQTICGLPLEQFSLFVDFLEKIKTKLLMYVSCYAAGTNTELIYTDARSGAKKTYSFAIVTYALTDAPVAIAYGVALWQGHIVFTPNFLQFMQAAALLDASYNDVISSIEVENIIGVPQIKYPGLTWFSVFDRSKVAPIGSIMAKTRTKSLDVATFFAEKWEKLAAPMGILLYADSIPFEIVVDTRQNGQFYVPTFVSMIPGNVVHYSKKITSHHSTIDDIVRAFYIKGLTPRKVFIIDEITAPFSPTIKAVLRFKNAVGTLSRVVIENNQETMTTYFTFEGNTYVAYGNIDTVRLANQNEQEAYRRLLGEKSTREVLVTQEFMDSFKAKANELFKGPMLFTEAAEKITELLEALPNDTVLRVQSIKSDIDEDFFRNLMYPPSNVHKVLWIENFGLFNDIIIELVPEGTTVFFRQANRYAFISSVPGKKFTENYVSVYKKLFDDFQRKLEEKKVSVIESRSIGQLLTLDSMNKLRARLAMHAAKVRAVGKMPVVKQPASAPKVIAPPVPPRPQSAAALPTPAPRVTPPPVPPRPLPQVTPGSGSSAPEKAPDVNRLVQTFAQAAQLTVEQAVQKMTEIINVLPSGAAISLPEILTWFKIGASTTFVTRMAKYQSVAGRKTVGIKKIGGDANSFSNVIIDSMPGGTRVLYTFRGVFKEMTAGSERELKEDYVPAYATRFK